MSRQYDNRGRDQFNFENVQNIVVQNREQTTRSRAEWLLLQQVKLEVASRLEQSLHNKVMLILGKRVQPEQVKRLWDAEVKIGSKSAEPLLPQTSILDVFERSDIAGQLLILGTPGAGKTTTMLDLGQSLVEKATEDSSYPIPVLISLSSWKNPRQSIPTWLVEELHLKYGVRKDIGKKLLKEKLLLPMLDALDEVKPEHQESCVGYINSWLRGDERPLSTVVSSRREEYENYKTRLRLNGAITLQELTDEQIQEYLSNVKRVELWQLLQQEIELLKLLRNPLLLSITVLSYEELSLQEWEQLTSTEQRIKMLLDVYVQRMFQREMESKAYRKLTPPGARQTQYWLTFLAQQLQQESKTEFLIEKMQPSWLSTHKRETYQLVVDLVIGLILIMILVLFDVLIHKQIINLFLDLSLIIFVLTLRPIVKPEQEIKLAETIHWNWSFKQANLIPSRNSFMLSWLIGYLSSELSGFLVSQLIVMLVSVVTGGLIGLEVDIKRRPNQGIRMSAFNALLIPLTGETIGILIGVLIDRQRLGLLIGGSIGGSLVIFSTAGQAVIQHLTLRLTLYTSKLIPWNYARFLNYCTERCFLQRVGGRYRFIHKLVQDHFAEMPIDTRVNRE